MDQLTSQFQIMKMRREIEILHEEIRELKLMLKKHWIRNGVIQSLP